MSDELELNIELLIKERIFNLISFLDKKLDESERIKVSAGRYFSELHNYCTF